MVILPQLAVVFSIIALIPLAKGHAVGEGPVSTRGITSDQSVDLGKRIYEDGILPSGKPLKAVVAGDVVITGTQFSCVSCHQRSGMGAIEGDIVVLPVTGGALYKPRELSFEKNRARKLNYRPRPAYTDASLATAIRDGIDSAGVPLAILMPRYEFTNDEIKILIRHLKTLALEYSPGVTDESIYFATVTTEDVAPVSKQSMMDVLNTFFRDKNAQTRNEPGRAAHGPFYREHKDKAYRKWVLNHWALKGPPDTWKSQLEAYYQNQEVFALISGISSGEWRPIHEFCESYQIPSILPNTDLPAVTASTNDYTYYYSKGLTLEAEIIAKEVASDIPSGRVLQIFRSNPAQQYAARALRQALAGLDNVTVIDVAVNDEQSLLAAPVFKQIQENSITSLVLWLGQKDLESLSHHWQPSETLKRIYFSSSILDEQATAIPQQLGNIGFLAHSFNLPKKVESEFFRVRAWIKGRGLTMGNKRITAQTLFACTMTGMGLQHIRRYFYRDYFVDSLDHTTGMAAFSGYYPRLSFGPGQRYLAKGCYLLPAGHSNPTNAPKWIVPW